MAKFSIPLGSRVIVNSYRVANGRGILTQFISETYHVWVKLDKPYRTMDGRKSVLHKCNAGNIKLETDNGN